MKLRESLHKNTGKSIMCSKEFLATIVLFLFAQDYTQIANTQSPADVYSSLCSQTRYSRKARFGGQDKKYS